MGTYNFGHLPTFILPQVPLLEKKDIPNFWGSGMPHWVTFLNNLKITCRSPSNLRSVTKIFFGEILEKKS